MAQAPTTWIPTGSPESFAAKREHGFLMIDLGERRNHPMEMGLEADAELLNRLCAPAAAAA